MRKYLVHADVERMTNDPESQFYSIFVGNADDTTVDAVCDNFRASLPLDEVCKFRLTDITDILKRRGGK